MFQLVFCNFSIFINKRAMSPPTSLEIPRGSYWGVSLGCPRGVMGGPLERAADC